MQSDDGSKELSESTGVMDSKSTEVRRFELLRSELMELEKRVQRSADQYEYEEVFSNCCIWSVSSML